MWYVLALLTVLNGKNGWSEIACLSFVKRQAIINLINVKVIPPTAKSVYIYDSKLQYGLKTKLLICYVLQTAQNTLHN